jgi:sortase A
MSADFHRGTVWVERSLLAFGVACLTWFGAATLQAKRFEAEQRAILERVRLAAPPATAAPAIFPAGALIGSLEIRRLNLAVVVAEGDDDATLRVAVGHLPDTPLPWDEGNTALAAHRDTLFRQLKDIRVGDNLRLSTLHGDFEYRVRELAVVDPEDLSVLNPTERPTLTLITCYPFTYIGKAPQRFIVRAERMEGTTRS